MNIFAIKDIFTNIFLQSDIKTIHHLIILNKQINAYCHDTYLLNCKLLYNKMVLLPFGNFIEWYKIYCDGIVRKLPGHDYDKCMKYAKIILKTAEIESKIHAQAYNVHVRLPTGKSLLIYELLNLNMKNKCNTITFYINAHKISFAMVKYTNFERDIVNILPIAERKVSYQALIHYLTVLLYEGYYEKIIDHKKESYMHCSSFSHRYGIVKTLEILDIN